jgi:hypothetical protein
MKRSSFTLLVFLVVSVVSLFFGSASVSANSPSTDSLSIATPITQETIIPDFGVNCTSTGQLCDPPYSISVKTESLLQVQYTVRSTHCSSVRLHILVDGKSVYTSGFLGWPGASGEFAGLPLDTGLVNVGPVSRGTHTVGLQAEGQISGCNVAGYLASWGGSARVLTSTTPTPAPTGCNLYPIAIHNSSLSGVAVGQEVRDLRNGAKAGNFGWLAWTSKRSTSALVRSLTQPGDSNTYVNPNDPKDHSVSVGDNVRGRGDVDNSHSVREALLDLRSRTITVPVWDQATGQGSNLRYHVSAFAQVRLIGYRLSDHDRISVRFIGYTTCRDAP